jgi:hypothetical protein
MNRGWFDMNQEAREARKLANAYQDDAKNRGDEVKALRQTLVDIMEDLESFYEYRAQEILLKRVQKNGHDKHLINRLIRKM